MNGDGGTRVSVVPLPAPSLQDIPAMLREAADTLEAAGRRGGVMPDLALLVLSTPGERVPAVRHYGRAATLAEIDGLMLHAILFPAIGVTP